MTSSLNSGPQLKRDRGAKATVYQPGSKLSFTSTATNFARFQVPVYASTPAAGSAIGDICAVGGKLYICTAAPGTWVVVGTQS